MLKFTYVGCDLEHKERTGDDMQPYNGEKKEDLTKVFVEEVKGVHTRLSQTTGCVFCVGL